MHASVCAAIRKEDSSRPVDYLEEPGCDFPKETQLSF